MKSIKNIVKELGLDEDFLRISLEQITSDYAIVTEISEEDFARLLRILKVESDAQTKGLKPAYDDEFKGELAPEQITHLTQARSEVLEAFPQDFGNLGGLIIEQLALINAQKLVHDYTKIHTETFEAGLSDYHESFAEQAFNILKTTQSRNPDAFLERQGIKKKRQTSEEILNSFQALINSYSA